MQFPKAKINTDFYKIQSDVSEIVTSIIIYHEKLFYNLIKKDYPNKIKELLASTNSTIILMITKSLNNYFNKVYLQIQNKINNPMTELILKTSEYCNYGPHILLDKMLRITLETHLDIIRENLIIENIDLYLKSVLTEINIFLQSLNLFHVLAKGINDDVPFMDIPEGKLAFDIVIDKNIGE